MAVTEDLAKDLAAVARIDAIPMILEVVCRTTGLGFSAVARVTEDRWIACAVRDEIEFGLQSGGELQLRTTICDEIRDSGNLVVIDNVAEDEAFCHHPTPQMYGFQSYISVPIRRADGRFFGTLCGIDPRPARLKTPETVGMFKLFADLIAFHLDAQDQLTDSATALRGERQTAELREQFIAVLGHDLRTPLAAIDASADVLLAEPLADKPKAVVERIKRSAARMADLIGNVVDFARGRLGGGLPLTRVVESHLETILLQVVSELQSTWPNRVIECDLALGQPVSCDGPRIAQLFSNLLGNALAHGADDSPIWVRAASDETAFELAVTNRGEAIHGDTLDHLFRPFARATARTGQQGLGLGLYIAAEIARAHGGTLEAASTPEATRFTFHMPTTPLPPLLTPDTQAAS